MNMGPPRAEYVRRRRAWLLPALLLAFAPKCVLCLLGYAGIGIALGLGGPEICGEPGSAAGLWMNAFSALGFAVIAAGIFARRHCRVR